MKVLIVGLGSIAKKHIRSLKEIDASIEVFALRSTKQSESFPEVIDVFELSSDLMSKIDFAIVSNPSSFHVETIKRLCTIKSIPIMVEKPLCTSQEQISELWDLINLGNVRGYVACNLRFHPALIFFKDFMSKNTHRVLEVNSYCGSYLPDWRPDTDYRESYSSKSTLGGGVELDLIHELDYITWLFGLPSDLERYSRKISELEISSHDYTHYVLSYPGFSGHITLNYYRRVPKRTLEVVFENQVLRVDLLRCEVINLENEQILFQQDDFNFLDTYTSQMNYFLTEVLQKSNYMNTFDEALRVTSLALIENK
jgi:predicted dehydrogenase